MNLEHVEFLVIDEADRLLGQSYHEWLPLFLKAAHRTEQPTVMCVAMSSTLGDGQYECPLHVTVGALDAWRAISLG